MARKKKQQAPDDDVRVVPIEKIRDDGGTQTRVRGVDDRTKADFAEIYRDRPSIMPPLECVAESEDGPYWLWDGFGRLEGLKLAGMTHARVRITVGNLDHARYLAGSANKDQHARRRSHEDGRNCVRVTLSTTEAWGKSDRLLGDHCGVDGKTVASVRREISEGEGGASAEIPQMRTVERGGKQYTMDTANIGKKKPEEESPAPMPWDLTGEEPAQDEAEPPALSDEEQQAVGERLIRDAHAEPSPSPRKPKAEKPRQEEVRDAVGNLVPSRLRDVFADAKLSAELARVRAWRQAVEHASFHRNLGAVEAHYRPWLKPGVANEAAAEAHAQLTAAEQHVERALPYALCPHCLETAGGCDSCRGTGWVPRWRYEELEAHARLENGVNSAGGKGAS